MVATFLRYSHFPKFQDVEYFCEIFCCYFSSLMFIDTLCQAIGLLIGTEDVLPEKQSDYLSSLLSPLCQQVNFYLKMQDTF